MSLCLECIALNEEEKLCFRDSERTKEYGWIGYLRGDFGRSGEEFHSTWFEGDNPELNNEQFKALFDSVINILRQDGDLFSDMPECVWKVRSSCLRVSSIQSLQPLFHPWTRPLRQSRRCGLMLGNCSLICWCSSER